MSMILVAWQLVTKLWIHCLIVLVVLYLVGLGLKKR